VIEVDERLYLLINGLVGKWPALDRTMAFLVNDYFVFLCFALLLVALWFAGKTSDERHRLQVGVLRTAAAMGIVNGFVKLFNEFLFRPRPFTELPARLLFYQPTDSSFPSNSVSVAFAAATGLWMVHRKLGWGAFVLAAAFAFSRVYAGVHYPLDVVGGATLGVITGLFALGLFKVLKWAPLALIWVMRRLRLA
jgi:undecaprenyl-diphosphatase